MGAVARAVPATVARSVTEVNVKTSSLVRPPAVQKDANVVSSADKPVAPVLERIPATTDVIVNACPSVLVRNVGMMGVGEVVVIVMLQVSVLMVFV